MVSAWRNTGNRNMQATNENHFWNVTDLHLLIRPLILRNRFNSRNMHSKLAMKSSAASADENAKIDRCPCRAWDTVIKKKKTRYFEKKKRNERVHLAEDQVHSREKPDIPTKISKLNLRLSHQEHSNQRTTCSRAALTIPEEPSSSLLAVA
jgi:hypothetical protein